MCDYQVCEMLFPFAVTSALYDMPFELKGCGGMGGGVGKIGKEG
jgi:hypothetical protein